MVVKNLHMEVQWNVGSASPNVIVDSEIQYGLRSSAKGKWRIVVEFSTDEFGGMILEDEDGSALVWNDFVANEWVELYATTPLALMRLAVLLEASEREAFFVHDHFEFAREAHSFMQKEAVP